MPKEKVRVAKVERSEDEQLKEITYQLEAMRNNMAVIIEAQRDLHELVAEGNEYRRAAARLHEVRKRDPFWVSIDDKPEDNRGISVYARAFGREDDEEENKIEYAFCFDVVIGNPWHIRIEENKHRVQMLKKEQCIPVMRSLCSKSMMFSVGVPVCSESLLTQKICPECAFEYLKLEGENKYGNEKEDSVRYGT